MEQLSVCDIFLCEIYAILVEIWCLSVCRTYGIDEKYVRLIDQKVKHMKFP